MTQMFQPNPEWRYTWEDLANVGTPEELHRVSYGRLLHRLLPHKLPPYWGFAFVEFGSDRSAAEDYRVCLASEPKWSRLFTETVEIRTLSEGRSRFAVALGPIGAEAWSRLPDGGDSKVHFDGKDRFSEEMMELVREELGGVLMEPLDSPSGGGDPQAISAHGATGIPGIREAVIAVPSKYADSSWLDELPMVQRPFPFTLGNIIRAETPEALHAGALGYLQPKPDCDGKPWLFFVIPQGQGDPSGLMKKAQFIVRQNPTGAVLGRGGFISLSEPLAPGEAWALAAQHKYPVVYCPDGANGRGEVWPPDTSPLELIDPTDPAAISAALRDAIFIPRRYEPLFLTLAINGGPVIPGFPKVSGRFELQVKGRTWLEG